jgi:rfaE bifunctional protein nucleotidyltransferase chain/domain
MKSKITTPEQFKKKLKMDSSRCTVVFTNGCFDILHYGHVKYLLSAKSQGDILVVGLNSDASVRRLKGPGRPIQPEKDRAGVLSAMACVDYVIVFNEDTPLSLIKKIEPDVLIKGGDWPLNKIVGGDIVRARGGRVMTIPFLKGRSTSSLVRKIQQM